MLIPASLVIAIFGGLEPNFAAWGLETIDSIQNELFISSSGLYGEEAQPGKPPAEPAFTWSVGVMVQALNAATRARHSYSPFLQHYIEATKVYWNPAGPVAGYDVLPMPKSPDRYYDDNEWMILAFAESAKVLRSKKPLELAKSAYRFVMSGKDSVLGGGVYWREVEKTSKNTCSNGPAAASALALYEATKDKGYLQTAEEIYAWTKQHLRDPSDGLYWDNISLKGNIQNWKFSYNTGLMLRTACDLYRFTKKPEYAGDAREMQASSLKFWCDKDGSFKDDLKFMPLLLENWQRAFRYVPNTADPRPVIKLGLTRMHDEARDSLGHYGNKCNDKPNGKPYAPFKLIDQASAALMYLLAASDK